MGSIRLVWTAMWLLVAGCGRSEPWRISPDEGGAGGSSSDASGAGGGGVAGSGGWAGGAGSLGGGAVGASGAGSWGPVSGGSAGVATGSGGASGTPPEAAPVLRMPANGESTGSALAERSLRPVFRWDAVAGATTYEIEIEADCPASDFGGCSFTSPERRERILETRYVPSEALPVSLVAPVGTRYFWRVRACSDACGAWSSVRYVDVGRQQQDLDGDGYADLWLRRNVWTGEQGVVDVYFGPPPFTRQVALRDRSAEPTAVDDFGASARAVGDANLDGYSDLALGCPRSSTDGSFGSVFLFLGGPALSAGEPTYLSWDGAPLKGFGSQIVALGDVNADGGSDFASGGAWTRPQPLSLMLGASLLHAPTHELAPLEAAHSLVPSSAGDIDADGFADFIAIESDTLSKQWVGALRGAPTPSQFQRIAEGELEAGWNTLIIGDVDGDGFADRATFDQNIRTEAPAVDISFGAPTSAGDETLRFDTAVTEDESVGVWPSVWGVRNAGDLDGDGLDETAVEIRLSYSAQIDVALFFGGRRTRAAADLVYRVQGSETLYVTTGAAHAAGDVNGDGFDDLFVVSDWDRLGRLFLGGPTPDTEVDQVIGQ